MEEASDIAAVNCITIITSNTDIHIGYLCRLSNTVRVSSKKVLAISDKTFFPEAHHHNNIVKTQKSKLLSTASESPDI